MKFFKICTLLIAALIFSTASFAEGETAYQPLTIQNLSQLYWTFNNKMDITKDEQIDNFLRINKCDEYSEFHHNELEWGTHRETGREFIKSNTASFPVHFEMIQPLRLTDYDVNKKSFGILDKYQINGVRNFELYAINVKSAVCGATKAIPDYEPGLGLLLDRPITVDSVPVDQATAEKYIAEKSVAFTKLGKEQQTTEALYDSRNAYLILKFRVHSYTGPISGYKGEFTLAGVMATLEGYDIFADDSRTELLYSRDLTKKKEISDMEKKLIEEYEASKTKTDKPATP